MSNLTKKHAGYTLSPGIDIDNDIELCTKRKPETKKSVIITNEIHIKPFKSHSCLWCVQGCYKSFQTCQCCCDLSLFIEDCCKCSVRLFILLIGLSIIICIILSIFYGGYLIVLQGINAQNYGNQFDIKGQCIVTQAKETESEDCSSNSDGSSSCTTSYDSYYDFYVIIDDTIFDDMFPCDNGTKSSDSERGRLEYTKGDFIDCYTNDDCDGLRMNDMSEYHRNAFGLFIGAALIFCIDLCCIAACFVYLFCAIKRCWFQSCEWCLEGINCECCYDCFYCCEYYETKKNGKDEYYENEWSEIGNRKQCDYVLGNWVRKCAISASVVGSMINNDVLEIVAEYYR